MAFLGADTDELREAGQKCQEGKETTDEVIAYLRALIIVLRAASFFTGGASAAYAEYLQGTVVPWLEKVSQALGLMAQVLLANAKAQDDASDGRTVDFSSLPVYSTPGGALPSQPIAVWDGQLVPQAGVAAPGTGPESGAGAFDPASADPAASDVTPAGVTAADLGSSTIGGTDGPPAPPLDTAAAGAPVGTGISGSGTGGIGAGTIGAGATSDGIGAGGTTTPTTPSTTGTTTGTTAGTTAGAGTPAGEGLGTGGGIGGPVGSTGGGIGGGIGTGAGEAAGAGDGDLASYSTQGEALGSGTPGGGPLAGDSGLGAAGDPVAVEGAESSYGTAATVAGGAALAGLGGAALAGRGKDGTDRIDELGTAYGRGSRGEGVSELQQRLTDAGYDTRGVDGRWGPDTQRAYDAYREANPLQIRHGSGFTSPDGFDYRQVTGVSTSPNVTPEFLRETEAVAQRIGAKPEHLLAVMSFETGGEFGADTPTKAKDGTAVGLIQFTPVAREQVGVTRDQLVAMTPTEQLAYVEKYFETRRGPHLATVEGLYTSVLYGTGHTDPDHVLFRQGERGWDGNKGLDASRDGQITVGEAAARVNRALAGR